MALLFGMPRVLLAFSGIPISQVLSPSPSSVLKRVQAAR